MWVLASNIPIVVYILDMWSVLFIWVVGSNIVIGLYALDMWSVLFVMYVSGMFKYSDCNERTGHVVSVVCSVYGLCDII